MEEFEKNGRIWENNGSILGTNGTFWEQNGTFWETHGTFWEILRNFHFFWHPSLYFSICPFLCHMELLRKMEHFEKFWEKWNILRKIRVQPELWGGPFVKNPTDLVVPFLRAWASVKNFWEKFATILMVFYLPAQVSLASKNEITDWNQMQSDSKYPKSHWWCCKWHTENDENRLCICMPHHQTYMIRIEPQIGNV